MCATIPPIHFAPHYSTALYRSAYRVVYRAAYRATFHTSSLDRVVYHISLCMLRGISHCISCYISHRIIGPRCIALHIVSYITLHIASYIVPHIVLHLVLRFTPHHWTAL